MSRIYPAFLTLILLLTACMEKENKGDAAPIRQKAKSYEEAYNKKDAKALAAFWSEDAEYVIPDTDEVIKGRAAIEKHFSEMFQSGKDAHITIKINSVTFPKNDQAVETGTVTVKEEDLEEESAYKATYIKQGGEWLLKEVREAEVSTAPEQNALLKELDWLVGKWVDEDKDMEIVNDFRWDKYKNFLIQEFTVNVEGALELEGKQLIAYDPIKEELRSWIFDSDGGFGEGVWKKNGNTWVVEVSQTLADGGKASATNVYTKINDNSYTWKSVGRDIDGELLPDVGPVTIVRRKA